jgi:2'-5' RNA ligase
MDTRAQDHKTIRCFIALTIPIDIQKRLSDIQAELKHRGAEAHWVKQDNIHITLRFLGDLDLKRVDQITKSWPKIFTQTPNFKINIDTINAFPNIDHPKVLWAGISDGSKETIQLFDMLNDGLAQLGIPKDRELFIPHFTLARCKTNDETRSCAKAIKKAPMFSIEARPQSITFYQSILSPSGSIYRPIY